MWLKQLFETDSVDFEKICKRRMQIGGGIVFLGALAIFVVLLEYGNLPILYQEEGAGEFTSQFYLWTGLGLIIGGVMKVRRSRRLLKNPDLKRKQEIIETDERNRELGVRCWAYSGYIMFLLLYLGIFAGGFVSMTIVKVLLGVIGVYALLLFIFRSVLQKRM